MSRSYRLAEAVTQPKSVVRSAHSLTEDLFLKKDGTWGSYEEAQRFKSVNHAEERVFQLFGDNFMRYGIFPCSESRRLRRPVRER